MELLQQVKYVLDDITNDNKEFNGIEKEIWLNIVQNEENLFVKIVTNTGYSLPVYQHNTNDNHNTEEIIDIVCELILLFSIFKPHFHYRIIRMDPGILNLLSDLTDKSINLLASNKPHLVIFSSEIYYATKIKKEHQLIIIKNYFSVNLDTIYFSITNNNFKSKAIKIQTSIFTKSQQELGYSSLIILLEIGNKIVTFLDFPDMDKYFEDLLDMIFDKFSLSLNRETEKPSCYLNYRVNKHFKKCIFNHHQILCIMLKISGKNLDKSYLIKEPKIISIIKQTILSQLEEYKNKYVCELFDTEKDYKARKMLELESKEVAELMINIDNEIGLTQVSQFIHGINEFGQNTTEESVSIVTKKIIYTLLNMNN